MKTGRLKLADIIYNLVLNAGLPLVPLAVYFGYYGREPGRAIKNKFFLPGRLEPVKFWLHGASVGEIKLVNKVVKWLKEMGVSGREILVTAQTFSGVENANHIRRLLLPLDYSWLMKPLARQLDAGHLLVMETELWPNLYRYHAGKVSILNGKIKKKTYSNYCWFKPLISTVFSRCRGVLARTDADRERFEKLGCSPEILQVTGSLKWLELLEDAGEETGGPRFPADREVIVAGSTHPGEEELALELLDSNRRALYLAPRHLERIEEVKELLEASGYDWRLWSAGEGVVKDEVILIDEMGLLAGLYGRGDVAFVGGSWAEEVGGHNLLEPAAHGLPVVTGPHLDNVREVARILAEEGLLFRSREKGNWPSKVCAALELSRGERENIYRSLKRKARDIKSNYSVYLESLIESVG